jgi:DNA-directed RNA polymerase specialized sigma24 family protein
MSADTSEANGRLLLRDALDALPPESRRVLSSWLVGGASFAELLATTGLSSSELRAQLLEGLNLLTEAACLKLRSDSSVATSLGLTVRG